jgi:hypothetical protein
MEVLFGFGLRRLGEGQKYFFRDFYKFQRFSIDFWMGNPIHFTEFHLDLWFKMCTHLKFLQCPTLGCALLKVGKVQWPCAGVYFGVLFNFLIEIHRIGDFFYQFLLVACLILSKFNSYAQWKSLLNNLTLLCLTKFGGWLKIFLEGIFQNFQSYSIDL